MLIITYTVPQAYKEYIFRFFLHFGHYLVNHSSNEDEIAQEYRETILLSKYLLKLK